MYPIFLWVQEGSHLQEAAQLIRLTVPQVKCLVILRQAAAPRGRSRHSAGRPQRVPRAAEYRQPALMASAGALLPLMAAGSALPWNGRRLRERKNN